jgi:hypothetical protein
LRLIESTDELARALDGRRFINTEFMYKLPPDGRAGIVFDAALKSRLAKLDERDAVLFICDSAATADALAPYVQLFPRPLMLATVANPAPYRNAPASSKLEISPALPERTSPYTLEWEQPDQWQRYTMTDRWARITVALQVGAAGSSYVIMPAHDAVWGEGLLDRLVTFSQRHAKGGLPAAVSPYPYAHHSQVDGAAIPSETIALINTAFNRDPLFPWKLRFDRVQGFWGKMGMIPYAMCRAILEDAEMIVWEDDLEIDRVIRARGWAARALWVDNASLYRQALPVFDRDGVKTVIMRTLHYSLNIPGQVAGASTLNFPLGALGKLKRLISPSFAHWNAEAEALIAECVAEIAPRLDRYGASWVDWGAYRHVVRVGDPEVEVWRKLKI